MKTFAYVVATLIYITLITIVYGSLYFMIVGLSEVVGKDLYPIVAEVCFGFVCVVITAKLINLVANKKRNMEQIRR